MFKNLLNYLFSKSIKTRIVDYNTGNITHKKEIERFEEYNGDVIKTTRRTLEVYNKDGNLLETKQSKVYHLGTFK